MRTWRWLEGERRALERARLPALLVPLERMLARRPWLASLASVRALWTELYAAVGGELAWLPAPSAYGSAAHPQARAALMYFANALRSGAIDRAYRDSIAELEARARRVPKLCRSSREALDTAVAEVASSVRAARAKRRDAGGM